MSRPNLNPVVASRLALVVFKSIAAAHVLTHYGYTATSIEGASMLPTFDIMGEWVLISSRYRHGRGVAVGDLITYDIPVSRFSSGLKRVVGMPGDYVSLRTPGGDMVQVPEGHCWIEGDNLTISRDSRDFGPLPLGLVRGKVLAALWPFRWLENGLTKVE